MIRWTIAVALLAVAAFSGCKNPTSSTSRAAAPPAQPAFGAHSIEELIDTVAASDASFEYLVDDRMHVDRGPAMAEHLRAKLRAAGSPEITIARFISRYGTFSDDQGSKYRVRLADGSHAELADWLRMRVAR